MEPLHPEVRKAILDAGATATPADIAEYQRLLAARYQQRPSEAEENGDVEVANQGMAPHVDARRARLAELRAKLFPASDQVG